VFFGTAKVLKRYRGSGAERPFDAQDWTRITDLIQRIGRECFKQTLFSSVSARCPVDKSNFTQSDTEKRTQVGRTLTREKAAKARP
jgi:hypothetical protein